MRDESRSVQELRRELRSASGDHDRIVKLNSLVTSIINHPNTFGDEKIALLKFRQEIKEYLNCKVL